jgi:hypothetical protein
MDFNIVPFESVGPIRFGMTPEEVRKLLPFEVKSKNLPGGKLSDYFEEIEVDIDYYQQDGIWKCTSISLWYPANPIFQGRSLLELEDEDALGYLVGDMIGIIEWLKSIDSDFIDTMFDSNSTGLHEDSILYKNLGILLYQPPCSIATVSVYAKGCDSL